MMKISFSYMALFLYAISCLSCHHRLSPQSAETLNLEVKDHSGNPQLLGKATRKRLEQPPYDDWFNKTYGSYVVDSVTAGKLRSRLAGKHLLVFMGTWCGDSRREVPRFYRIMDYCGIDTSTIELVMVSNADSLLKQSPGHEEKGKDIFRVPDFIVLDHGKELGRIIESPVTSLESDLLTIAAQEPYTPHYQGGAWLAEIFRKKKPERVRKQLPELVEKLRPLVSSSGELSSYARVLRAAGEQEKADLVLDLNSQLFPSKK